MAETQKKNLQVIHTRHDNAQLQTPLTTKLSNRQIALDSTQYQTVLWTTDPMDYLQERFDHRQAESSCEQNSAHTIFFKEGSSVAFNIVEQAHCCDGYYVGLL